MPYWKDVTTQIGNRFLSSTFTLGSFPFNGDVAPNTFMEFSGTPLRPLAIRTTGIVTNGGRDFDDSITSLNYQIKCIDEEGNTVCNVGFDIGGEPSVRTVITDTSDFGDIVYPGLTGIKRFHFAESAAWNSFIVPYETSYDITKIEFYLPEPDAPNRLYKILSTTTEQVWTPDPPPPNMPSGGVFGSMNSNDQYPPGSSGGTAYASDRSASGGSPPSGGGGGDNDNDDGGDMPTWEELNDLLDEAQARDPNIVGIMI